MKTVRILGNAPSLALMSRPPEGVETWCCNQARGYKKWLPRVIYEGEWTRWFNLHSREHQKKTYPRDYKWLCSITDKPIYTQYVVPEIPASVEFPRYTIQNFFALGGKPTRYFTCSVSWLIALAIMEGFDHIELWGIEIAKRKPAFAWERPCTFYWILEAQKRGVTVTYLEGLDWDFSEAGDPLTYTGPLYGYATKPEVGWNPLTESFDKDTQWI